VKAFNLLSIMVAVWTVHTATSLAATYVVTTTADSGPGSLRQAILDANADSSTNDVSIEFNIPGSGVQTIAPLSILPSIQRPLTIDGYTQPGSSPNTLSDADNAVLLIEVNGANAGYSWGLALASSNIVVRGLVINTFIHDAIFVDGPSGAKDCVIEGNFIGVDPSGTVAKPTGWPSQGAVEISASPRNQIGGTSPAARNLISGNAHAGLAVQSATSVGTIIQGNLFGTDATGTNALYNAEDDIDIASSFNVVGGTPPGARNIICGNGGVAIFAPSNTFQGNYVGVAPDGITVPPGQGIAMTVYGDNNLIGGDTQGAGNVFSGWGQAGLQILGTNNVVQGNLMGTDATGTLARGNNQWGLLLYGARNLIGGLTAGAANVISANTTGISVENGARGNVIQGNLIGTDKTGSQALPNHDGIDILNGVSNVIGGVTTTARNVISGNSGGGMGIAFSETSNNVVQGNYIGLAANGTTPLPNGFVGIRILGSSGNQIGGTAPGAGNWIAYNSGFGISEIFYFGQAANNSFLGNQIFGNSALGIDLAEDGITANDAGDPDDGPNHLQNFPDLTSVKLAGRTLKVEYKVDSPAANSAYPFTVEFFIADGGQGRTFIHRATYSTPQVVDSITFKPSVLPTVGDKIVATATDSNGNTSEFSVPIAVARNGNGN
jgi:titin